MRMRLDDVFDLLAVSGSFIQVLLNVALRIDDRGLVTRANIIRRMGKASQVKLFELHRVISEFIETISPIPNNFRNKFRLISDIRRQSEVARLPRPRSR